MARALLDNVVAFDDGRILSRSASPGQRVYDEELHTVDGAEFRTWNPARSKLGAYLMKGGRHLDIHEDSTVLYLGAANGTTPSHVSDIVQRGTLVAVEFSPRSFRDLLRVAQPRVNMVPVLADAWRPELYERFVGKVDLLFQDIAQRQQAAIFAKNMLRFKPALAIIAVKARSVDVAAMPRDVYQQVADEVEALTGYQAVESVELGPFEKDHAAVVFRPGSGKPRAVKAERRDEREERPRDRRDERPRFDRGDKPRFQRGPGGGGGGGGGGGFGGGFGGGRKFEKRPYDKRDRPAGFERRDRPQGPPRDRPDRPKWK